MVDTPGAEEVHLTGEMSPMSVDVLKRFWPKFLAGKARGWVLERVAGGQVLGGKFSGQSWARGLRQDRSRWRTSRREAVNVELNLSGMSIAYISQMPPVADGRRPN